MEGEENMKVEDKVVQTTTEESIETPELTVVGRLRPFWQKFMMQLLIVGLSFLAGVMGYRTMLVRGWSILENQPAHVHEFGAWGQFQPLGPELVQVRTCNKCGLAEMRRVRIQ
jgi:hypothetical protein